MSAAEVGTALGPVRIRVTRADLVRYAGASTDFNPIHYSDRAAATLGLPGVLAHGMWTMGVALSSCVVPEVGRATFTIGDDEMEIGMGIHGEPGIRRGKLQTADAVVDEMLEPLLAELNLARGDSVAVLVNGLGGTPKEELYVLYRRLHSLLAAQGVTTPLNWIGEFATSMEMAGASLSLMRLDDELTRLLAAPARTPFFEQHQR